MSTAKKDLEISWLGLDGFLVVLYFIAVSIIYYAISVKNDWIVSQGIPYGIMITVTMIFINYLCIVFKFSRPQDKKLADSDKSA